ncbi:hypothetical protein HOLleu_38194 [Holothuria leucospilota]|uniref:Uncharacterized protein n=1 Tax=Holothuria leucospilota TaxID=206669 RepID=A0A9Q0YJ10_HOLLE|nr:hypothetical protein HOLleu_38194 [Holothuria leucospilota]
MAAQASLPFDPLDRPISVDIHALGPRWKKWITRFENFSTAVDIVEPKHKRALLLHSIGKEAYDIFDTLPNTGKADEYDKAVKALSDYFTPQKNTEYEVYLFHQATQKDDESVDM